jgi:hypothetical protein
MAKRYESMANNHFHFLVGVWLIALRSYSLTTGGVGFVPSGALPDPLPRFGESSPLGLVFDGSSSKSVGSLGSRCRR